MVLFGSALLEKNQSGEVPNHEPMSKPILNAISQAIVMAMERQTYNRKMKRKES